MTFHWASLSCICDSWRALWQIPPPCKMLVLASCIQSAAPLLQSFLSLVPSQRDLVCTSGYVAVLCFRLPETACKNRFSTPQTCYVTFCSKTLLPSSSLALSSMSHSSFLKKAARHQLSVCCYRVLGVGLTWKPKISSDSELWWCWSLLIRQTVISFSLRP